MLLQDEELDSLLNDEEAARNAQLGTTSNKPYDAAQPKKTDVVASVPSRFDESMRMGHSGAAQNPDFQAANKPSALEELLKFQSTPFSKPKQVDYQSMLSKQASDRQAMQSSFDPRIADASKSVGVGRLFDSGVNAIGGLRNSFREMTNANNPALKLGAVAPTNVMESEAVAKQKSVLEELARKYKGLEGQQDDELNIARAQQSQLDKDYSLEKDARVQVLEAMKFRVEKERQYIEMGYKREDAKIAAEKDLRDATERNRHNLATERAALIQANKPAGAVISPQFAYQMERDLNRDAKDFTTDKALTEARAALLDVKSVTSDPIFNDLSKSGMFSSGLMDPGPVLRSRAPEMLSNVGLTPEQQMFKQKVQRLNVGERAKVFGASLSAGEKQSWNEAMAMIASGDPAAFKQAMATIERLTEIGLKNMEAGFRPEAKALAEKQGFQSPLKPKEEPKTAPAGMVTISKGDKTRQATPAEAEALSKLGWKVINGQ